MVTACTINKMASRGTPENCKTDKDCTAMMVSWEGEAEIQSGDILIVEINDALLTPKDINLTTR
ncbi:hypothetical protein DOY81_009948 [Sarcophaga bullata]|nr:hypothetical protein DOY81_009948 [Sarcophaga bullata]